MAGTSPLDWIEARLISGSVASLCRRPMFIVLRVPRHGLRLVPTRQFWIWMWLGLLLPSFSMAAHWAFGLVTGLISLAWLARLLRRSRRLGTLERSLVGPGGGHDRRSPFARRRSATAIWLPSAWAALLSSLCCVFWGLSAPEAISATTLIAYLAGGGLVMALYGVAILTRSNALALPDLEAWLKTVPAPWRALIEQCIKQPPRHPSVSWRSVNDVSSDINAAGVAMALFSDNHAAPIWRRSARYLLWYLAPAIVPLAALVIAPLAVWAGLGPRSFSDSSKLAWGLASISWVTWVLAYFCVNGARDFALAEGRSDRAPTLLTDMLRMPHRKVRQVAADYIHGQGSAVFGLVAVAILPSYMGYLGLFSHADASTSAPACNEAAASAVLPPCSAASSVQPAAAPGSAASSTATLAPTSASASSPSVAASASVAASRSAASGARP